MPEIAASIVTINWNSGEMTAEAIDSLLAQTIVDELEIVVVDNGSTDSSDRALEKKFGDRIILVRARSNLGYAGGSNAGAARATGRYVIFFNNDAVACAEWASQLVNAADNDDTLGMCTSRIMCYDDRSVIDNVGHNISGDGIGRSRGHLQPMSAEYKTAAETLLASGCAGLYRRDLFEQVGGFDEDFFAYCEDSDIGLAIRGLGYRCLYVPAAVTYHRQSATASIVSLRKIYWIERNRIWVVLKHFPASMVLASPFVTLSRLLASSRAGKKGDGMAGEVMAQHSSFALMRTCVKAWCAALLRLPRMMKKRRQMSRRRVLSGRQWSELLKRFAPARKEMSFGYYIPEMDTQQYKAKQHYQDESVAANYDDCRFKSLHGRIAHAAECGILRYILAKHFERGESVVDIPCGTGRLLETYCNGQFKVTGCDISEAMLDQAKKRFADNDNFQFQSGNAEALPFEDGAFEYLVSFRFVLHLPPGIRHNVLTEMIRVSRRKLAVNFYFNRPTPLLVLNRLLGRTDSLPPHRISETDLPAQFEGLNVRICEVRKIGWFDRNWALVILEKT